MNIQTMLDEAQKAEFKKQNKKALDKYYDVLFYYLKHKNPDDPLQEGKIEKIKKKILDLGGELP